MRVSNAVEKVETEKRSARKRKREEEGRHREGSKDAQYIEGQRARESDSEGTSLCRSVSSWRRGETRDGRLLRLSSRRSPVEKYANGRRVGGKDILACAAPIPDEYLPSRRKGTRLWGKWEERELSGQKMH